MSACVLLLKKRNRFQFHSPFSPYFPNLQAFFYYFKTKKAPGKVLLL